MHERQIFGKEVAAQQKAAKGRRAEQDKARQQVMRVEQRERNHNRHRVANMTLRQIIRRRK